MGIPFIPGLPYNTQIPGMYQMGLLQRQAPQSMGLEALGGPLGLALMTGAIAAPVAGGFLGRDKGYTQPMGPPSPVSVGQTGDINPAVLHSMYGAQPRFRSLLGQYLR